ncbi:MAG: HEPN domain-containing protein [Sphaerochaetaceae bacterium]|nr:HEPN domain-containing protein [Sphaerochaetaceae bacterium]
MRFACDDLEVAIILSEGRPLKHEIICFHCQQAAEKSLKGYLLKQDITPPRTHDLERLVQLCIPFEHEFEDILDEADSLTDYGVTVRYPAELEIDDSDVRIAISVAQKITDLVQKHLS